MKLHYIAAGALLLGTSALAWQPEPQSAEAVTATAKAKEPKTETSGQMKKAVLDVLAQESSVSAEPASAVTWDERSTDLDLAEDPDAADSGEADTSAEGVGGPLETAALDLAARPATRNYPPCRPGPGDDNCIQLYEPGVRTALAAWNGPAGGLIDGEAAATAMGGPFEPVAAEAADMAMAGDGVVDSPAGETADIEPAPGK